MSNVIKNYVGYTFQDEDHRVIDTNQQIADRLEMLSQIMQKQAARENDFDENFTQGLDAMQVERLLSEEEGLPDSSGAVIKAQAAISEDEIRAKCDEMLSDAQTQADSIIEDAKNQAGEILERARQEGHSQGYADGLAQGKNEARQEYEAKLSELENKEKTIEAEYEAKLDELEPQFIDTLTSIYEHIFHVKLSENKEIIFYLIQDAIRKVEGSKNFIIHVSKEDYGFVSMQKKELLAGFSGADSTEIVEDMTLRQNECFIETGSGIFDCSLETQLEGLKRELRLLSFESNQN